MARNTRVRKTLFVGIAVVAVAVAATALAETAGALTVTEIATARVMVNGVPEAPVTTFTTSDRIYCFMRVENRTGAETAVLVSFERAEGEAAPGTGGMRLSIPASPRYRTFARTGGNRPAGQYRCVVRSEAGDVLETSDFEVTN
jgi:hypothetical protein